MELHFSKPRVEKVMKWQRQFLDSSFFFLHSSRSALQARLPFFLATFWLYYLQPHLFVPPFFFVWKVLDIPHLSALYTVWEKLF